MSTEALNAICPYYTMYPLSFPLGILEKHGRPGHWVLDPFCGRGTTNFAARLLGMPSVGIDSSPVAAALAKAKLATTTPSQVTTCARAILNDVSAPAIPVGEFWTLAFHPDTLVDLCRLRDALSEPCSSDTRIMLRAIILGALHGPRPKGSPSYFSNQAPRTFAPKPRYSVKFWRERNLQPTPVDTLEIIARRARRYLAVRLPEVAGTIAQGDSRRTETFDDVPSPDWIITSPPYYGTRTYLPDQWLRLWFLGGPAEVNYEQRSDQLRHSGAAYFADQMAQVWSNAHLISSEQTRMVVRFGGIHDRDAEPMEVLRTSLASSGWRVTKARGIPDADSGKRQVRQFQAKPKKSVAEYDVYCRHG